MTRLRGHEVRKWDNVRPVKAYDKWMFLALLEVIPQLERGTIVEQTRQQRTLAKPAEKPPKA